MGGELILPEGHGQIAAPAAAIEANQVRSHTLVPAVWTMGGPPFLDEPKSAWATSRNYHRTMHVMAKSADSPLCRGKAPAPYDTLYGLTQAENQEMMLRDAESPQWHHLMWCGSCATWARVLTARAA